MPSFPITDAHVHLWDNTCLSYPWLKNEPELNRPHLPGDYDRACGGIHVDKIVFVQCECEPGQAMREVDWITKIAAVEPRIRAVIPRVPLEKGIYALPDLERLTRNRLVKGVRRLIQSEEDMQFCLRPRFIEGIRLLPQFRFTFDLGITYRNNGNTIKLIEKCPGVRFMLDHIGRPNIRGKALYPWRREIMEMAQNPNVYCKISSLATEANRGSWTTDDLRPFAETVFECFGFDRVAYGSDWPVSSLAATIPVCVRTIEELLTDSNEDNLRKLFRLNAERFYGI